jgi:hypothetical protein
MTQNVPYQFITHSVHIFSNINSTESNEQESFNISLTLVRLKNLSFYTVGAGAAQKMMRFRNTGTGIYKYFHCKESEGKRM